MRPPFEESTWLVTGASSGIGRALAREVAPRVGRLALLARRADRLEALRDELVARHPGLVVDVYPADLLDRAAVDAALEAIGAVDVLVNNAGSGDMGVFDQIDWTRTQRMIRLDVEALVYLTHKLVPAMVERGRGGVLNVSSGFGLQFLPGFATYIGAKHFVTGFTEALRLDLASTGVVVSQVCPGPVATEFESNLGNFTGQKVPSFIEISAETCARAALRGFARGRALIVPGVVMKILLALGALTPRWCLRVLYAPVARHFRKLQAKSQGR